MLKKQLYFHFQPNLSVFYFILIALRKTTAQKSRVLTEEKTRYQHLVYNFKLLKKLKTKKIL